ncbi:MAG: tryptophan-rich sensory protein [Candidatus Aenigmarchaeota archaeon]|nr:tryptophan-rich sensory protein [Candidatus Aenigmarchaeota archaeon]
MTPIRILKLLISIIVAEVAGSIGSIFTMPSLPTWYASLAKPWFTPPNWVFAPVWTILFALMGISAWIIWDKGLDKKGIKEALFFFDVQFILNILWSFLFFGLRNLLYALIEIIILWIAIALTIWKFYKIDKRAAYIMLPYIAWVCIALALNLGIVLLN